MGTRAFVFGRVADAASAESDEKSDNSRLVLSEHLGSR